MLLSDIENMTRQDLFDTTATRWQNSDIDRAIDKAVDRYSAYYPNIAFVDMQMQPYQRTYPYPPSWNPAYPVLWIEKVLYPLQVYGSQYAAPLTAPVAAAGAGAGLGIGLYQYRVTYLTQGGETTAGPAVSVSTSSGSQQVALSNIPIAPAQPQQPGIATNNVIGRNLYRTLAGGSTFHYLVSLQDNSTSVYTDNASDSALAGMPQPPGVNTSGVMVWPPYERSFSEYSNMYDSSTALAAGGNMGLLGAIGDASGPTGTQAPSFTLSLSPAELPKDNTLVMRVFYATRQQLDNSGSTIPEVHRDIIVLGAIAYALEAYQIPTNDNFDFQDGTLRDRIDDTAIPGAWLAVAKYRMQQFESRLQEIKQQRDFASSARAHWGDVPVRYARL
ncbi:MAG TPA: hypothetical protein VKV37_24415 [Ktedonobacteraceae bacterium]|nr:hypothetical protein [Ktedonobacteraceae bacterium]